MKIRYDPGLVEEVVHLLARGQGRRWREYRRTINPLYEEADRGRAFDEANLALFAKWGAAKPCEEALAGVCGVEGAVVARCLHPGDEGADLLAGAGFTVSLRLEAGRFLDQPLLRRLLRHELRHIRDLLDPAFGYSQTLFVEGRTRPERELVRGRYRVLWNVAIDAVEPSPVAEGIRRAQLERAFASLDGGQIARLAKLFEDPENRTHSRLAAAAIDPQRALGEPPAGGRKPGEPCPLCGFPTFDWDENPPHGPILADQPGWRADDGACRQCSDLYRAGAAR